MAEYIDRAELLAAFAVTDYPWTDFEDAWAIVQNAPAADVAPVQRGEWEWYDEEIGSPLEGVGREWGWRCSNCKTVLPDDFDDPDNPPGMRFCPWCGAKMDGDVHAAD